LVPELESPGGRDLAGLTLEAKEYDPASVTRTPEWEKRSDAPASPPYSSWPLALRRVRAWLELYVMLMRYWRAFSDLSSPPELEALLEWVFSGPGTLPLCPLTTDYR